MQHTTITPDDLSSASHVADTLPPSTLDATSLSDAIQAPVSDPIVHSATTIRPDTLSSASHVDDTTPPLILDVTGPSDAIQAPMSDLQLAVTTTEPAAQVNAALPSDVTATALEPSGPMQGTASASHVDDTTPPLILDVTGPSDAIQAPVSAPLQPEVITTVNYAALPGEVTATALEPSGSMQAFDHQAQHDLEAGMSDGSTVGIVGIDLHHSATALV